MAKKILVLGAGKSATRIISYLLEQSIKHDWKITVGDIDKDLAVQKINGHPNGTAVKFNVTDDADRDKYIGEVDIVASLLPFIFHKTVAQDCLRLGKHLVTASYVDQDSIEMDQAFRQAGLLFMGEIGLDPGIDHLATMRMLDDLQEKGAKIEGVFSHAGALMHPESLHENPWKYKFTWAPMNVVKAGQGISQYLQGGELKYVPYNRVFNFTFQRNIQGIPFEIYPNRDSPKYLEKYHLKDVGTFMRGTIRYQGYCDAWDSFVELGWTNDSYEVNTDWLTYTGLLRQYLPEKLLEENSTEEALALFLHQPMDGPVMDKLRWLELFDHKPIAMEKGTPAQILHKLLSEKWKLEEGDKDMIVMLHEIDYSLNGEKRRASATLIHNGVDSENTAIASLVGLPSGMMVKLIANGKLDGLTGVKIPIMPEVYNPILTELEEYGVVFEETDELV